MSRSRHWCFTLNNYSEDDARLFQSLPQGCIYSCVGKEVGDSGTPHLQGFLSFTHPQRLTGLRRAWFAGRAHWETARSPWLASAYCKKAGDYQEFGQSPTKPSPGTRTDLSAFKNAVKGGCLSSKRLREDYSDVYARYPRFCGDYIRDNTPTPEVELHPLRDWQGDLYTTLRKAADRRSIVFVVDSSGNTGKSWFCDYYAYLHPEETQVLTPGKYADMALALDPSVKVLFLDCPRSKQGDFIQYDFLENVKNGRIFSGKYESGMKYLNPLHVVVMMNECPDMRKLSEDRYNIIDI